MYFSRITLRRDSRLATRSVHQLLSDSAYEHHRLLWRFFPAPPGSSRDFLFRYMDVDKCFYVVSTRAPQAPDDAWDIAPPKPYDPNISSGTTLRFELRANPVVAHQRNGRGKRDDVVMHAKKKIMEAQGVTRWKDVTGQSATPLYELAYEEGQKWLTAAGHRHGFELDPGALRVDGYLQHRLIVKDRTIRLSTLDFSGALTVTDAAAFRGGLLGGIGHAKAFGCGLLLVRRA